eukprot:TRINITY_DN4830_c0_g1_i1.p1 TRINITY_DN4830_c0_g1~~TRINITY_DN4830_c0_g1_i1.p1  ORF type:complete len:295 (-),score=125.51 TRINITY_DN4830_c0_g1_i1:162-1025(-)
MSASNKQKQGRDLVENIRELDLLAFEAVLSALKVRGVPYFKVGPIISRLQETLNISVDYLEAFNETINDSGILNEMESTFQSSSARALLEATPNIQDFLTIHPPSLLVDRPVSSDAAILARSSLYSYINNLGTANHQITDLFLTKTKFSLKEKKALASLLTTEIGGSIDSHIASIASEALNTEIDVVNQLLDELEENESIELNDNDDNDDNDGNEEDQDEEEDDERDDEEEDHEEEEDEEEEIEEDIVDSIDTVDVNEDDNEVDDEAEKENIEVHDNDGSNMQDIEQ